VVRKAKKPKGWRKFTDAMKVLVKPAEKPKQQPKK
jgi:hypothetical protein